MKRVISLLCIIYFAFGLFAFITPDKDLNSDDDIAIGVWISEKKDSKFKIYKKNGEYYGKLIWATPYSLENKPFIDKNNPDKNLKNRNLLGEDLLIGFRYVGNNVYKSGKVYDPGRGKFYSCKITVKDDSTAHIRGYILFPALGRTEVAHRVNN